ncbi:hypothetical protein ROZALSC1DRAFT_29446 [Rozella allomycis CSF55]|uniref:Uncharacterized protein n=1 Tax=Rozella allomycis (strain CSF55) TaxID=988480 RepID=A0A075AQC2_ROZAC|nr:hypothetical protein O9G_001348 [Rozella allomycis CSF55]RKP18905.1 hypothetical protein ROZALSC1DRAFT_29446 [Rozella allomycis CSF55]|eukprot:EPZ32446.1 hypothetical protein O9G_001348 [Rozella allomycis CSF55]
MMLKEDIMAKFSCSLELHRLDISTVVHTRYLVFDPEYIKYRTAIFMELLTGTPCDVSPTDVHVADPLSKPLSHNEEQNVGKLRGKLMTTTSGGIDPGLPEKDRKLLGKGLMSGIEISTVLQEFYLIDETYTALKEASSKNAKLDDDGAQDNVETENEESLGNYETWRFSDYSRRSILTYESGKTATSVVPLLALKAKDLLKIPDIETYLEFLPDILIHDKERLNVLIRPSFKVQNLFETKEGDKDNLKVFEFILLDQVVEYAISQLFSNTFVRPMVRAPRPIKKKKK